MIKECTIEMNYECCICLEYLNTDIHLLKCCLNNIHTKCIYEMFVFTTNDIFTCPLCRTCDKFNDILTLKDIKKYTNNYDIINKYKEDNENDNILWFIIRIFLLFIMIIILILSFS